MLFAMEPCAIVPQAAVAGRRAASGLACAAALLALPLCAASQGTPIVSDDRRAARGRPHPERPERNASIAAINAKLASLADGRDVLYLDIDDRLVDARGVLSEAVSEDGLHLELAGYRVSADALKPILAARRGAARRPSAISRRHRRAIPRLAARRLASRPRHSQPPERSSIGRMRMNASTAWICPS